MKVGIKTRKSFWATKCGYKWSNNEMRILNNKILKIEEELQDLREWLFKNFTDFKPRIKKRKEKNV